MNKCTFKIVRCDWMSENPKDVTEEKTGYEVSVRGLRCFVDRRKSRCWTVTEALTGFAFAHGNTRAQAIAQAEERLRGRSDGFLIEAVIRSAHSIGAAGLPWPVNAPESTEDA